MSLRPCLCRLFILLAAVGVALTPGHSALPVDQGGDLKERVSALAGPILAQGQAVGIAIGILDGEGKTHFFAFGRVSKEGHQAPNEDTLFELGSITKCFTGILLAEMVLKGEVKLEDPAEKYLPRGDALPRVGGRPLTLAELATYSAGLPRMPNNMGRTDQERARYSPEKMLEFLKELARKERGPGPDRHYLYSNLGFALLGHCLSDRAREPIRPLIVARVARPLGMENTTFEPGPRQQPHLAKTYSKEGKPMPPWETGAIAPAGMLRSTTRDMVKFIAANVGRVQTPLDRALRFAQEPRYQTGTTKEKPHNHKIGLAWFIEPESGFIHHDGATNGSSSNVVFDPKTKIGVVVLMNQKSAPAAGLSMKIMGLVNARFKAETFPHSPRGEDEPPPGE